MLQEKVYYYIKIKITFNFLIYYLNYSKALYEEDSINEDDFDENIITNNLSQVNKMNSKELGSFHGKRFCNDAIYTK